jgi:hypothetical protein
MTENENRVDIFVAFESLAEVVTEMRVGQIMAAVGELCADLHGRGLWDASDAELLEAVWQFRRGFDAAKTRRLNQEAETSALADR